MKKNNKPVLEEKEQEPCVGTCFACVPQCERRIPERMENAPEPVTAKKIEK